MTSTGRRWPARRNRPPQTVSVVWALCRVAMVMRVKTSVSGCPGPHLWPRLCARFPKQRVKGQIKEIQRCIFKGSRIGRESHSTHRQGHVLSGLLFTFFQKLKLFATEFPPHLLAAWTRHFGDQFTQRSKFSHGASPHSAFLCVCLAEQQ